MAYQTLSHVNVGGDPETRHRAEIAELWPHTWHMACTEDDLPQIGAFVVCDTLAASWIVVRGQDRIHAYLNRCPHRGARLADDGGICLTGRIECPFHGWQWDLTGQVRFYLRHQIANRPGGAGKLDLVAGKVAIRDRLVFVQRDDAAASSDDPARVGPRVHGSNLCGSAVWGHHWGGMQSTVLAMPWRDAVAHVRGGASHLAYGQGIAGEDALVELVGSLMPLISAQPFPALVLPNFLEFVGADNAFAIRVQPVDATDCRLDIWQTVRA